MQSTDAETGITIPTLRWIRDAFLVMTPIVTQRDTKTSEWGAGTLATDGGTYEEARPYGHPSKLRLLQTDTDPTTSWSRKSTYRHRENASFAFTISLAQVAPDKNEAEGHSYAAFSWANGKWAIFFYHDRSPILGERVSSTWVARRALGLAATDEVIGLPAVLLPWKWHDMFLPAFARLAELSCDRSL
ncbi:MAG: hypothetical protein IIB38_06350 [Candidatus Hydrogenedentes bacterium]|nr:hypothetical protein [Candidatus Hydrogenedentota bacterium]